MIDNNRVPKRRIVLVVAAMLEGKLNLLEGCRIIVRLRGALSEPELSDPDLLVLIAVESELDDIPLGTERQFWNAESVAEKDIKMDAYLKLAREEIFRASKNLLVRWSD